MPTSTSIPRRRPAALVGYLASSAKRMQRFAVLDSRAPLVRRWADALAPDWRYVDFATMILRIWQGLPVQYMFDGRQDRWQRSVETLRRGGGDCEDLAILTGALLLAMEIDARVAAMPSHVMVAVPYTRALIEPWGGAMLSSWATLTHGHTRWLFLEVTLSRAARMQYPPGEMTDRVQRWLDTPYLRIAGVPSP